MDNNQKKKLQLIANNIRKGIIEGVHSAGSGHPGGSLSIADVLAYLYFKEMNIDPKNPDWEDRDRMILSKGHTAPGLYSVLANRGYFPVEELKTLRKPGSFLQGHPDMKGTPGCDMSSGSLGQGISVACGMALASKLDGDRFRVYSILGDGELEEGQVWEAAMFAGNKQLDTLCAIVDNNNLQIDGTLDEVNAPYPIDEKFKAFNFNVINVDGHDFDQLENAFKNARETKGKPTVIIMKTTKGKGVSFMEDKASWHGAAPNDEQYEQAMKDLDEIEKALMPGPREVNTMSDIIKQATREAYGEALAALGEVRDDLIVLDADLSGATKTGVFKKKFPERFFNCGIAEQNLIGVATGLTAAGKLVFASSFAMFAAGRAFEQVRNAVGYTHLNVKIAATHAGLSVGEDGATHQCNEDIALMRTIPGMTILSPADGNETKAVIRAAAEFKGPVYIRLGRMAVPMLFPENHKIEIGKSNTLRAGTDVTIIATGIMTYMALDAAKQLEADGISARVINIHTIKPLDEEAVIAAAKQTGAIVTAEEHSIIGGLGSAVCDVVSEKCPVPVIKVGVNDEFGKSGPAMQVLESHGLSTAAIVEKAKTAVAAKK